MALIRMVNTPLEQNVAFSGRLQYKFLDEEFSRPLVEKLLFPEGRVREISPFEAENFILAHKAKLSNMVLKNNTYSERMNRLIQTNGSYVYLVSLNEFFHEKLSATVSMTIAFTEWNTLIPNFLTRYFIHRKMITGVTYLPKEDKLTIKPLFEENGFDVILRVNHVGRKMTWSNCVNDASGCKKGHLDAVRDIIQYRANDLQTGNQLNAAERNWNICILIVLKMEDHLATIRYIKEQLAKCLQMETGPMYKCVVMIKEVTASVLTEKELVKFFQAQDIYLVFSRDIGYDDE
jgi:hypothetical protein